MDHKVGEARLWNHHLTSLGLVSEADMILVRMKAEPRTLCVTVQWTPQKSRLESGQKNRQQYVRTRSDPHCAGSPFLASQRDVFLKSCVNRESPGSQGWQHPASGVFLGCLSCLGPAGLPSLALKALALAFCPQASKLSKS